MRLRIRAVAMFLVAVCFASAQSAAEPAIRQVLAEQVSAWNRGDIEAFMTGYENSPETTFIGKTVQHGWRNVLENYHRRYATRAAMGTLDFSGLDVRTLDAGYAVVTGSFHLARTTQGGGDASGIFSLVFRKTAAGWKVILDHTS